jgi:cold shock CspA family protein
MEEKEEKKWASGIVKFFDIELNAGIIQQIDGEDVLFAFSDMEGYASLAKGQEVLYNIERDLRLGLKAKNITPLKLASKA